MIVQKLREFQEMFRSTTSPIELLVYNTIHYYTWQRCAEMVDNMTRFKLPKFRNRVCVTGGVKLLQVDGKLKRIRIQNEIV